MTPRRIHQLIRILICSLLMGAAVWGGKLAMDPWFDGAIWQKVIALGLLVGFGASIYGVLLLALKATTVAEIKAGFRR